MLQNETIVDNYLEYLKWEEFQATRDAFPPARPIQDVLQQIKVSKVYEVLKKFPKGGNMHLHQSKYLSILLGSISEQGYLIKCTKAIRATLKDAIRFI